MIRSLLKIAAYRTAPVATFALAHPKQTARLAKFRWDMRHAPAPRIAAVGAAVGAITLALPIGMLLGRARRDHAPQGM